MVTYCTRSSSRAPHTVCPCGAPLYARYDLARAAHEMRPGHLALREGSLWRYREVLPLPEGAARVTLGEGMTPLLPAPRLGARLSLPGLLVKEEGGNPTGSFKARGLAVAVSMVKALGATDVCLPSAGNAGSALAAYAAAAGLRAHVFLPRDIARLFLMETEAYGAHVELEDGLITDAGRVCAAQAKEHGWYECATLKEPDAWIAVAGDFNAESEDVATTAIRGPVEETGNPAHAPRVMLPCEKTIPESSRYSLFHLGKGLMLDHVFVSRPLSAHYHTAEIHNEVLPDESGAFRTDVAFPESDHGPVVAEFLLP